VTAVGGATRSTNLTRRATASPRTADIRAAADREAQRLLGVSQRELTCRWPPSATAALVTDVAACRRTASRQAAEFDDGQYRAPASIPAESAQLVNPAQSADLRPRNEHHALRFSHLFSRHLACAGGSQRSPAPTHRSPPCRCRDQQAPPERSQRFGPGDEPWAPEEHAGVGFEQSNHAHRMSLMGRCLPVAAVIWPRVCCRIVWLWLGVGRHRLAFSHGRVTGWSA
jgi:hypothetical protein